MATLSPSWTQVHPSFVEPDILMQFQQASGAFDILAGSEPRVKIGSEDLYVYLRRLDIRARVFASQTATNQLPSVSIVPNMISMPTYIQRVRAEYDHHDTANASHWGFSIVEAQRLGMRQAHFQLLRNHLLYGVNPANGEGVMNAPGIVQASLPADSFGATTFSSYDNGQMAVFLLTQLSSLKTRTLQFGLPNRFVFLGPQRILGSMATQNIVQLTAYQRPGAGTATTAQIISKGLGGTDALILAMPEVKRPTGRIYNSNEFAQLTPGLDACLLQYLDMSAPVEIPTPLAGGAIDVLSEWRTTPGWPVRPEATTIISMAF
jgi:hypothetical protein